MTSARANSLLSSIKDPGGPQTRPPPPVESVYRPPLAPSRAREPAATQANARMCFLVCKRARATKINREANSFDQKVLEKIAALGNSKWKPNDAIDPDGYSAKLAQLGDKGITDVSRFLSDRNCLVFSDLWDRVSKLQDCSNSSGRIPNFLAVSTVGSCSTCSTEGGVVRGRPRGW